MGQQPDVVAAPKPAPVPASEPAPELALARGRRAIGWLAPWLGFGWMALILVLGIPLAARIAGEPLLGEALTTFWTESLVEAAVVVYAIVFVPMLVVWLIDRALALPIGLVTVAGVLLAVGDATGSLPALAVVAVQSMLAWFLGLALVSLVVPLGAAGVSWLVRSVAAFAAGNGLLGMAYLGLGSFGLISAGSIVAISVVLLVIAVLILLRRGWPDVRLPEPLAPSLLENALLALALAFAAWALLYAFVPETLSDAVRHHLPITREIWQGGAVAEFPWWTSWYPIHAQLVTVPAWAVGGTEGVTLSHSVVGLVTALGAAGLAQLLAGPRAAAVAFAAFVAMPLFLWEVGHAYVDLYPAMFVAAAAVTVVLWQRLGPTRILLLAGFLAGLAFVSKTTAASGVGALGLAVVLVGRERFEWRSRLMAGLTIAAGGLIVFPWLWRSYQIIGTFPGLDLLSSTLTGSERDISRDLGDFGVGRGPLDLLAIPWTITFDGQLFGQNGAGALGVLLLMAVPLVVYAPRTRSLAFALVLLGIGALAWAFTAQYLRYSLPLATVLAALAGVGVTSLGAAFARRGLGWMSGLVLLLAGTAIVLAPLMSLPARRNQVPVEFLTGELSREAIVSERIQGYDVLQAATDIVGADEPLLWVGGFAGGIYTEATIAPLDSNDLGDTNGEVMQTLQDNGVEYLAWQLDGSSPRKWAARVVSPGFLRARSELVMTADHTYLFRLGEDLGWEQGPNVLPGLDDIGPLGEWATRGNVVVTEDGAVIPAGGNIKAAAPVAPGATYIVRFRGTCENEGDLIVLILWKDANGITIARDRQRIIPPEGSTTFILTTAVDDAEASIVHLAPRLKACTVTNTTMRQLVNAPAN